MKKKFISAILCAAMTMSLLAGCGSSTGSSTADNSAQTEDATEVADSGSVAEESASADTSSDEPCEIYMFISSPEYADAIGELIDAYKEVAPNVTINYETTQND